MRNTGFLLAVALALGATQVARADDRDGPYLGLGFGASVADIDAGDVNRAASIAGLTGSTLSVDDTDTAWKVFAGYRFKTYFAAEFSYTDLGETSATYQATAPTAATLGVSADATALSASLVGTYALSPQFDIFAKAGLQRWDVEGRGTAVVGGTSVSTSADDDGTDVLFGLGAGYHFTNRVGLRLEWERYNNVSDTDVDLFSGSLYYRF